ncbi:Fcar [Phodopus roborovskii]|uniref:Fcar protein n=1 Tax=Phodopus roborovskii TaxID=109678 RepID=A0AAU9YVP6_PHORO|nr:Fcar [Phodopus roborovskii]
MASNSQRSTCLCLLMGEAMWVLLTFFKPSELGLCFLSEFPTPIISAATSTVVPWNGSVRIICQGTPEAFLYQLSLMKNSTPIVIEYRMGFQREAEFIINHMNTTTAGCYQCQYRKKYHWSEKSKPLELVVTGVYDKPILSADQSHVLKPGENISFQCRSAHNLFNRFSLAKEGDTSWPQQQHEGYQGNFILGPVHPDFAGSYRCYGWHSRSPYVWSAPSDALELSVTGCRIGIEWTMANTCLFLSLTSLDSKKQDYVMENSIRMGMAGLILVVVLVILAEYWNGHRVPHKEDCWELAAPGWSG